MPAPTPLSIADWLARAGVFLLLAVLCVSLPHPAGVDLDPSWRMALGGFFRDGLQFGRDVVFTYGPLGFLLGNTDDGVNLPVLLAWQAAQALLVAGVLFREGLRVPGYGRYAYFAFVMLLGVNYHDLTQQIVMLVLGLGLLRDEAGPGRRAMAFAGAVFALFALIKFTNLVLGVALLAPLVALLAARRRFADAAWAAAWFGGAFLLGWILCRQNPLHLPAYLFNSWEISQGYQEAMGIATPPSALVKGLAALGLVIAYAGLHLLTAADRWRAFASALALGGFTYLNWKHGFVRADGHMVGFFFAMLLVATTHPVLLGDAARLGRLKRAVAFALGLLSLLGISDALPGLLRGLAGYNQDRAANTLAAYANPSACLENYRRHYDALLAQHDLPKTREIVGRAGVDVLGCEQAVALLNGFNYQPRPVIQGYSVYRPHLARLNLAHYASERAPEFVLAKIQTIDGRLPALDDSEVLRVLPHLYDIVHLERGFLLWRRRADAPAVATLAPGPGQTVTLPLGAVHPIESVADQPLWATVEVRLNWLGRLRSFFYKPPMVTLLVRDAKGHTSKHRMPLPQGRTGFIAHPVVEDFVSYLRYASPRPERLLAGLGVEVAAQDTDCFEPEVRITLQPLPRPDTGTGFFRENAQAIFSAFKAVPISHESQAPVSAEHIDGEPVMVLHAPSSMLIPVPEDVTEFAGSFGFMPGAYLNGGDTDGAIFSIAWQVDGEEIPLFERGLFPVRQPRDRGLQHFSFTLPNRRGGNLVLRITPGPAGNLAWDWTAWGGLQFR